MNSCVPQDHEVDDHVKFTFAVIQLQSILISEILIG